MTSAVPGDSDRDDKADDGVTRRDFARLGLFAGGVALTVPSIRTISFAGKIVGSVHTPPPSTSPASTTPITPGGTSVSTSSTTTTGTSTTTTTFHAAGDAAGGVRSGGTLPFTGAAIGGLAVVGGAAVAVGRAMTSASKAPRADEHQDLPEGEREGDA